MNDHAEAELIGPNPATVPASADEVAVVAQRQEPIAPRNGEGREHEALSSLLLLLKSNQSKAQQMQERTRPIDVSSPPSTVSNGTIGENTADAAPSTANPMRMSTVMTTTRLPSGSPIVQTIAQPSMAAMRSFTTEELRKYFHLPIVEVAKQLGICTTLLKKLCRKNKIHRWPYRQIRSISKSIQSLEMAALNEGLVDRERSRYRDQIGMLQHSLEALIQDPNIPGE